MPAQLPPPSSAPRSTDHIFVSYSSKDRAFVDRLAKDLRDQGHTVWIDFEGIFGGDPWKQSIADGLHASRVVLLILSPESVVSEWVEEEIETARDVNKPIVPLLLRSVDAKTVTYPNLRFVLDEIQYRNFTGGYEQPYKQLLGDLPKPKSGVPGHLQKLKARLAALPWGLDHYIQEEAKLLPLNASPYEEGGAGAQTENVLKYLAEKRRVILLGEPGTGKTVALERFAWELANQEPPIVPIIVKLLEYDGQPVLEWVRLKLIELGEIKLKSAEETRVWLNDVPFEGYFLLDGLNEVRPAYRDQIVTEITRLALEYPRHGLAVTSRVQDENWRLLGQGSAALNTLVVRPIRDEQAQHYLIAHLTEADGQKLWSQLDPRMRGLAATPLMLWLIKEAWAEAKQRNPNASIKMPENRGELYQNFVARMLRRDDDRRLNEKLPEKQRLDALEKLALTMQEAQTLTLSRETALTIINDETILDAVLVNGLLSGERELRFAPHQTIQEHFAARAVLDSAMGKAQASVLAKWAQRVGLGGGRGVLQYAADPWWAETFIQMAGLTKSPNALAMAIAEYNPWLAWWCVEEGQKVDDKTRAAIEKRSMALVRSDNVADRRRCAQVLGQLQTERVIGMLLELVADADEEVGEIAAIQVRRFGQAIVPQLVQNLTDTRFTPRGRTRTGRFLAQLGDPRPGVGLRLDGLPDIVWCDIPAGTYKIGGDPEAYQSLPAQEIHIPYPYKLAKYPVTYAQYEAFVGDNGYANAEYWTPDGLKWKADKVAPEYGYNDPKWHIANHPVIGVTWYEAWAFTRWLTAKYHDARLLSADWEIRLPTEGEWEAAARYPDGRKYPWGDEYISGYANIDEKSSHVGSHYLERTSAVGIYPQGRNPHNDLYDMSGNVWEWCLTKWRNDSSEAEDNNPMGGAGRVWRGGAWYDFRGVARAAYRDHYYPDRRRDNLGFRPVASSPIS